VPFLEVKMKSRVKVWSANMLRVASAIGRKFMRTESEWNPKVMLGRAIVAVLPESGLHRAKKSYYAYLLRNLPDDWQEKDIALVRRLVRSGDSVVDIGSSIGGYTKVLSGIVGASGLVYSFEPNPAVYDFLSHNVKKLKLGNVKLFNSALSDKAGTASIAIPRYRWGSECHYDATLEANRAGRDCRRVEVAVNTLDSFFAERGEKIAFIKCDVNYHELACLRGGLRTIRRSSPAILIEILPDPDKSGSPAAEVFELLQQLGYQGCWFDGERLHERQRGERSQNYFFLTPRHVCELPIDVLGERFSVRAS
jgi:FkbM family methyltransferase